MKPIDRALIERCAQETGAIVTAEEHQIHGGLGGAVAEIVVQTHPVPVELVAAPAPGATSRASAIILVEADQRCSR